MGRLFPKKTKQKFAKIIAKIIVEDFSEQFPIHLDKIIQGKIAKSPEEVKTDIAVELAEIIDGRLGEISTKSSGGRLAKIITESSDGRLSQIIATKFAEVFNRILADEMIEEIIATKFAEYSNRILAETFEKRIAESSDGVLMEIIAEILSKNFTDVPPGRFVEIIAEITQGKTSPKKAVQRALEKALAKELARKKRAVK